MLVGLEKIISTNRDHREKHKPFIYLAENLADCPSLLCIVFLLPSNGCFSFF